MSIGIGTPSFTMGLPGWDDHSVGYRSKSGRLLAGSTKGTTYGPAYRATGDVVGCLVRFQPPTVCFSLNGRVLGVRALPVSSKYSPCIGVSTRGTVLLTNLGRTPFLFPPSVDSCDGGGICEALGRALDNEHYFPDVCFVFPGTPRTILAHRAVLVARSLQFAEMFGREDEKTTTTTTAAGASAEIEVVPIAADPRLFARLLKFIYSGSLRIRSKEEAKELTELAAVYSMDALVLACQAAIAHNFDRPPLEMMKVLLYAFRANARDGTCLAKRYKKLIKSKGITVETLSKVTISTLKTWGISTTSHRSQII
jgi:hypothetical protein